MVPSWLRYRLSESALCGDLAVLPSVVVLEIMPLGALAVDE